MKQERVNELLENAKYTFAKSMPTIPHEYTLRTNWNEGEFIEVASFINRNGTVAYFYGRPYRYYFFNGYKYWTVGKIIDEATLINREKL